MKPITLSIFLITVLSGCYNNNYQNDHIVCRSGETIVFDKIVPRNHYRIWSLGLRLEILDPLSRRVIRQLINHNCDITHNVATKEPTP